ncbi:MAG: hypothetical protein J2P56_11275 [Verrucomicrobia bacterium]|nr:hypothetical protein [Verrucomicrobiota bacterium]
MTSSIIVVRELSVRVVTGDTCYQYEKGFSAIYAEVNTQDTALIEQLRHARDEGTVVTLRCAMLNVTGTIGPRRNDGGVEKFVLSIEDVAYRKPNR